MLDVVIVGAGPADGPSELSGPELERLTHHEIKLREEPIARLD